MKNVYLLFYSSLDGDNELYGVYSTYKHAVDAIPPHEDTDYYDIYETPLNNKTYWNQIPY